MGLAHKSNYMVSEYQVFYESCFTHSTGPKDN